MNEGHNNQQADERLDAYDPPCPEERFAKASSHTALVHAWDILKLIIARFWHPVDLGALPGIRQWRMYDLLDWLRPAELMLRRLILLEAMYLAPALPEPAPPKPHPKRPRRYRMFDPQKSATWVVHFRGLQPTRPGAHPRAAAGALPARRRDEDSYFCEKIAVRDRKDMRDTWALAKRLEAAIRVAVDPMPWIRRLARRIRRKGAPDPATLAPPQKIRVLRTCQTLDEIGADLNLPPVPRRDSS